MGSGFSKHPDEIMRADPVPPPSVATKSSSSSSSQPEGESNNGGGGCPMKRTDGSYSFDWKAMLRPDFPQHHRRQLQQGDGAETTKPDDASQQPSSSHPDGCPMKEQSQQQQQHPQYNVYSQPLDPSNNMPPVANQLPAAQQQKPLSTERVASSIPKGGGDSTNTSTTTTPTTTWTYPSPQMFYNALARKGKLGDTSEEDIATVVTLHNHMNEKTWKKILQWEQVVDNDNASDPPKLLRFLGRPTDLSPKAALKHYLLGHPLPYDRHDWTIVHERDGSIRRYVIDYYHDETRSGVSSDDNDDDKDAKATPSLLVDVRPAADDVTALWSRFVSMPYARHVAKTTKFEPLAILPTATMKSQVQESVQVWQNIQKAAAGKGQADDSAKDASPHLTEAQAKTIAREFSQVVSDCRAQQRRLGECSDEMECARASMDLTVCMGKIVCPLQHGALTKALAESYDGDAKIEAALEVLSDCVRLKTIDHKSAKELYPKIFTKS